MPKYRSKEALFRWVVRYFVFALRRLCTVFISMLRWWEVNSSIERLCTIRFGPWICQHCTLKCFWFCFLTWLGVIVQFDCPIWLSNLIVQFDCPIWLSGESQFWLRTSCRLLKQKPSRELSGSLTLSNTFPQSIEMLVCRKDKNPFQDHFRRDVKNTLSVITLGFKPLT